ncbi:MAG: type II secretion system F family protein [Deltaproteobacteria bacterium]|nr:type II secretion system F family protein [Deltaproteobacteria bacterium]
MVPPVALLAGLAITLIVHALLRRVHVPAPPRHPGAVPRGARLLRVVSTWLDPLYRRPFLRRYTDRLQRQLTAAGETRLHADEWLALKALGGLVGLLMGLLALSRSPHGSALAGALGVILFQLPDLWLRRQLRRRQARILRAFPYYLDLLTLGLEAGLDFTAAAGRVIERARPGPLRDELALMLQEIRMGKSRRHALRDLSDRIGLPALATVIGAIVQADQLGTSLGQILRAEAQHFLDEQFQRAERLGHEAPVKLLLPLLGCIFPATFLLIFAPVLLRVLRSGAW